MRVLCVFCLVNHSLQPRIIASVRELGDLLLNIKGGGQLSNSNQVVQRNTVAVEADEVLRPLMDLLDGSLSLYAQSCEKTVLKRLLKELWKIVMRILEKTIVLPPMTDRTVPYHSISLFSVPLTFARYSHFSFSRTPHTDDVQKYYG